MSLYPHVTTTDTLLPYPGNYWLPQLAQDTDNAGDNVIEGRKSQRYKLEDDPMCGLTTGGQEQCYWDCTLFSDPYYRFLISNPECLLDCYEEVKNTKHHISRILNSHLFLRPVVCTVLCKII